MKQKIILTLAVMALVISGAIAQEQGSIMANAGLLYGTKAGFDDSGQKGGIGIGLGADYFITDEISGGLSYDFYFKSETKDEGIGYSGVNEVNVSSFNIEGKYYFMTDDIKVYGLFGLGFLKYKYESTYTFDDGFGGTETETDSGSESETGINIGGGVVYPLSDALGILGQIRYQSAKPEQGDANLAINAGVTYTFGM